MFNNTFENNSVYENGGAVSLYLANLELSQTEFTFVKFINNQAFLGGAVYFENIYHVVLSNSTWINN